MKIYVKAAINNILDEDIEVQYELASDPNTSTDVLAELATSSSLDICRRVLANPNTSPEILDTTVNNLITDGSNGSWRDTMRTLGYIASNPSANNNTLIKLSEFVTKHWHSEPRHLYEPLLKNPNTPADALSILINEDTHNAHAVTGPIINHPNVTLDVLKKLLVVDNGYCRYIGDIAKKYHLPDDFLWEFAQNGCPADKRGIADIDYVPSEILEYLITNESNSEYGYIRSDAISNPNLSVDVLYQLADNPNHLADIIKNPNCPSDILTQAADYYISTNNSWNLDYVASHPNTPVDVMYDIFEYGKLSRSVLSDLASNPNIPTELARQLLLKDDKVKEALAKNTNVDPEILGSLVKSKINVRNALAKNPNTPTKALMKLAKDKSRDVITNVAENRSITEDIFVFLLEHYPYCHWRLEKQLDRFPQYKDRFDRW